MSASLVENAALSDLTMWFIGGFLDSKWWKRYHDASETLSKPTVDELKLLNGGVLWEELREAAQAFKDAIQYVASDTVLSCQMLESVENIAAEYLNRV